MTNVPPHPPHTMKTNVLCPQAERSVNSRTHEAAVGCVEACLRCTHLGSRTTHAVNVLLTATATLSALSRLCRAQGTRPHAPSHGLPQCAPVIPTEESPFLWPLWRMIFRVKYSRQKGTPPPPLARATPLSVQQWVLFPQLLGPNFNSVPNVVQPHKTWVW